MSTPTPPEELYRGWLVRVPEYLGVVGLACLLLLTWEGWQGVQQGLFPRGFPTHFGASGTPDAWGGTSALYLATLLGVGMYALMWLIQWLMERGKLRGSFGNLTNPREQAPLAIAQIRWMKAQLMALFAYLQWVTLQVGRGELDRLSPVTMIGFVVVILATSLFFIVWLMRLRNPRA